MWRLLARLVEAYKLKACVQFLPLLSPPLQRYNATHLAEAGAVKGASCATRAYGLLAEAFWKTEKT